MAYTELVSSGVTLVNGGAAYAFAFDSPVAADGSPHITHFGFQMNMQNVAAPYVPLSGLSNIVTQCRVKVGSNIVFDWTNNAGNVNATLSQLGCLVQRIGGSDFSTTYDVAAAQDALGCISEMSFPLGLPADRTHRVNVNITLANEANIVTAALLPATSEMNISLNYGVSTEQTIVGAGQQFTMAANNTRIVTIYGKQGYNMLGVLAASAQNTEDRITQARVNNGAFRELTTTQWRGLNNSYGAPDATQLRLGATTPMVASGVEALPTGIAGQGGVLFMNLRRITAGANIDIAFTYGLLGGDAPLALYPVWVAPVSKKQGPPVRQTVSQPQSTTKIVEQNTQG